MSEFFKLYFQLSHVVDVKIGSRQRRCLREFIVEHGAENGLTLDDMLTDMRTALTAWSELGLGRHVVESILICKTVRLGGVDRDTIVAAFDDKTANIVGDLNQVIMQSARFGVHAMKCNNQQNAEKNIDSTSESIGKLLLAVVKDVRVLMILIVDKLTEIRKISLDDDVSVRKSVAKDALELYAPIAHRMGLYKIKTELEDLGLKWTEYETYKDIAHKLNERKNEREEYIRRFIAPVKSRLQDDGLRFEIKGRTKSIYSIWRKMVKQGCDVDGVYDLFAIRIIIDADESRAKAACWQAYAAVTDMYVPNTKRLRDWISVPKSNGYESLHITVMGPEGKWVEVQIRTQEMDEVAEKGVAAHWKYKGLKSDGAKSEEWLKQLREAMESGADADSNEVQEQFKMQLYDEDVFVFTPKGDLHQLKKGSTVLDMAFDIHSRVGETAIGGMVNGQHVQIGYKLSNGDQVEIITSSNQKPKADWLNIVVTQKARQRIKQKLREDEIKEADLGREIVERKFKNWKIDVDDSEMNHIAKKFGYDNTRSFFMAVNREEVDLLEVKELLSREEVEEETPNVSVTQMKMVDLSQKTSNDKAIIVGGGIKGLDYELAKCCNPVYGDEIFGFVGAHGGIKIHRKDCPNAQDLMVRMKDRLVDVRWTDNAGEGEYQLSIRVIGNDDIGILNNITSIISKENGMNMRNISLNSQDGLFEGDLTLMVRNIGEVEQLLKKLRTIKGVKQVVRI